MRLHMHDILYPTQALSRLPVSSCFWTRNTTQSLLSVTASRLQIIYTLLFHMQLSWRVIIMSANLSAALDYSTNIDVLRMAIINRVQWSKVHSPSWRWSSQNSPSPLAIGGSTAGGIGISDMPQLVESGQFGKGKTELLTNLLLLVRKLRRLRQFII